MFFHLSARLGLRVSEVYAIARSRLRDIPPQLIVDRAVQRGTKDRPAMLATRKNNEAYVLDLTDDIVDAIRWHIAKDMPARSSCSARTGASLATSMATSDRRAKCSACLAFDP
jgi:hypothetical protein